MHWILHDGFFRGPGGQALPESLKRLSLPMSMHKVVPFVGELSPIPVLTTQNVICMGAYSLRLVASRMAWRPGVFDIGVYDFVEQRKRWGELMLNHDSVVCSLSEASFTSDRMFVRPTDDSKAFTGQAFDRGDFEEWRGRVCALDFAATVSLNADTVVQVSPIKTIHSEYRLWVVKGEIVTASLYRRDGKGVFDAWVDPAVLAFAASAIDSKNGWQPHDAFVIDIADTPAGYRIIEINTLNASGLYACDVTRLILALEDAFNEDA